MVYLQTTYELCFGKAYFEHFESCDFCRENTNIDVSVFMFGLRIDKHVIWMWIWLILKNISLLDRIWSLWLVRFAHSPPSFIFWLGRLIFSVSINSHPDNIYLVYRMKPKKHIHVKYSWQTYFKSIGTLSQTFKNHIVTVACKWSVPSASDVFLSKNDNSGGKTREASEGVEYDFYFTEYDFCPVWSRCSYPPIVQSN